MVAMKRWLLVIGVPAVIAGVLFFWPLPYFSEGPGPTEDVATMVSFADHERFASDGQFLLTSVSQSSRQLSPAGLLWAWIAPNTSVVPDEQVIPAGLSLDEERELAVEQMSEAKVSATSVALRRAAGYPDEHGAGVVVAGVVPGCPAFEQLETGEVVTQIEGRAVDQIEEANQAIDAVPVEDPIRFVVAREQGPKEIAVTRADCIDGERPVVGVSLADSFPFRVEIDDRDISGPSAGLMIALTIYDQLTPDDLTDGRVIAGTGTIAPDGTVGPIGGVAKKVIGARAAGADLFLVPDENLAEAKTEAGDLTLVPISDFDEAVARLGGDTVKPTPSATPVPAG